MAAAFWVFCLMLYLASATEASVAGIYPLKNDKLYVNITNWGARLISVYVPDAKGNMGDILLGFDSLAPYMEGAINKHRPIFGATLGRVANRIKNAMFTLDGVTYHLPKNNGNNTLHGGNNGFDRVLWEVQDYNPNAQNPYVLMFYHSKDGEEGFPGDLDVTARYTIIGSDLKIEYGAVPRNKATPVCMLNHGYWNLAGQGSGRDVLNHTIKIWASKYTPTDSSLIPTGQILPVSGTGFDLQTDTIIGSRIDKIGSVQKPPGFDTNFVLDAPRSENGLRPAAKVRDDFSNRVLEVWTSEPGLGFYTAGTLPPTPGKGGVIYKAYSGFCLETQQFPNAVNQPNFPSVIVKPGQTYNATSVFKFSTDQSS